MDIACPNCAAAYRVPDALVFSRKPVRCAACGTRWVPDLPPEMPLDGSGAMDAAASPPGPQPASARAEPDLPPSAELVSSPAPPLPGPAQAPRGADPAEVPRQLSLAGEATAEAVMLTGAGALPPRPAAPPPLAETRWRGGAAPRRVRGGALLPLAWAGSLLVVGLGLGGLWLFNRAIAAAWPPFEWVSRLLGG